MKFEWIKYGIIFGFLKERGNLVIYLGPLLIHFEYHAKSSNKTTK